ncbi:MAG TPA: adenosylcobalamin-dependent ribonucleoside-diphosphate reductase [Gemmatimonadaceae bacterium]|nr:adenosylcobalamin-dependent ribonucleoside-diphosphate reductase [Gemmatimonadaceae bacterium]
MGLDAIPFQEASLDIWDKKYRLTAKDDTPIDRTMDDTYQRVARALADVEHEDEREHWNERFLWALRRGAIPAGRIISNAGALEHKPATSTINCTVSGTIHDSMDDILKKVHEAGLTLKAGCVAPGTWVYTEHGLVTADQAVHERHQRILCYDVRTHSFEKRAILRHLTTHVPQSEQIRITSQGATLTTSIRHPVLVYRAGQLGYVRADEVTTADALVRHQLPWTAAADRWLDAWFAGAHLGDGSAYVKKFTYKHTQKAWAARALALGQRLVFKIRAVEREVVQRYAAFFATFSQSRAKAVPAMTLTGTLVWDYTVASFAASRAAALIDGQIGEKSTTLRVPKWIAREPERFFLPFLAGLIDTDGTINTEHGSATIATACHSFAGELQSLLGLFGVHGSITLRRPRDHMLNGHVVRDRGGAVIKICDSAFLAAVAQYMADTGKRNRIRDHASTPGQYDVFQMPAALRAELERETEHLTHVEKQRLGIYHGYHRRERVSRVWIDRWAQRFAPLAELIGFALSLRPVDAIERDLSLSETFFDFTVDLHNNYLAGNNGLAVIHNCGIGYEFSTLRPRGAYVSGAGAYTSGPLSFMDIFDKMCFTVSSAGGRRGAQMGTFDIGHPDVMEFIRAKRESGRLRQFNLSLLITDEFMQAVREDREWKLAFPLARKEYETDKPDLGDKTKFLWREWPVHEGYVVNDEGLVACKIYKTLPARRVWDVIMTSTYDFAEPGFVLIDRSNEMNNNWWCENIRATNPCGEQNLPEYGACLLGSVNLTRFVKHPFTDFAEFDWSEYREVVKVFTRMLDNVVEVNGLPLERQREEILRKRRHGMGFLGLGSTLTLLRMKYGSPEAVQFTEDVTREMAVAGWEAALELSREKGPAPIMNEEFTVTKEMLRKRPEMARDGWKPGVKIAGRLLHAKYSRYMQRIAHVAPQLVHELAETGARFTHHTSIAPTGTISLSLANNASNGIEPSFAHHYFRNVIREGKKSKEKVDVYSFELLAYRELVNPNAKAGATNDAERLPDYFIASDDVTPKEHVEVQAAAQKWVDSSISKTANVPTDFAYAKFKDIYLYAYEQGLKGCTTFRFNPEAFQGVLVKEQDLKNTIYKFTLEDGAVIEVRGDEEIDYDGEIHTAANLFDAMRDGYYGRL